MTLNPTPPATPEPNPLPGEDFELLLSYLRGSDVPCPRCTYNLRDLLTAACPECGEPLILTVRRRRSPLAVFIALLAPSLFSGICTSLMVVALVCRLVLDPSEIVLPWEEWRPYALGTFGFSSAVAGFFLYRRKQLFFRRSRRTQVAWAGAAWAIHIGAFILMILVFSRGR